MEKKYLALGLGAIGLGAAALLLKKNQGEAPEARIIITVT